MTSSVSAFISSFTVLPLVGAGLYVADRGVGIRLSSWWHAMTHEHPPSAGEQHGFLHGRGARARFTIAVVLSVLQSAVAVVDGSSPAAWEILTVLFEVPGLMLGFYLGPAVYSVWSRRERMFETVDQLERGDISVIDEVRGLSERAATHLSTMHAAPPSAPAPISGPEPDPAPDPKALMARYTHSR